MAVYPRFGAIKELRKKLGLTQVDLANRCKISDRTVKSAEKGEGISLGMARKIADGCGISLNDLLSTHISGDAFDVVYDQTTGLMCDIWDLADFVSSIERWGRMTGKPVHFNPATKELVALANRIYGPFEPQKNKPLLKPIYAID